jgi:dihydrofolate synthase/folylpolyglutamate synthase
MTYAQAVDHLFSLGPELPTAKADGNGDAGAALVRRKFDLAHMAALCDSLAHPEQQVPSVLVAGTNGKGSTAATLASILTAAGYRTGLYTSPHLVRINERIQISRNGVLCPIEDDEFARLYTLVDDACERLLEGGQLPVRPSFFERVTAVGFLYFAREAEKMDVVVLEVGLGGRLDATNVVTPMVSVITDIALDHQEYLGDTITLIAREKCGILREHGTLVTLSQHPEANQAIGEVATTLHVRGINAAIYLPPSMRNEEATHDGIPPNDYTLSMEDAIEPGLLHVASPLAGQHQQRNIALAIATAIELRNQHGYKILNQALETGIQSTVWPGRLERIRPDLLVDVAHNPAGAWTLRAAIAALPQKQPRTLIFSCLRDKNLAEMARILFPLFDSSQGGDPQRRSDHLVLAPIDNARAVELGDLVAVAHEMEVPALVATDLADALATARRVTPDGGLIIATGSVYLVGEIRQILRREPTVTA